MLSSPPFSHVYTFPLPAILHSPALPFLHFPAAHPWRCGPGEVAHAQSMGWEVVYADGGLRCWWVLPAAGMAVKI